MGELRKLWAFSVLIGDQSSWLFDMRPNMSIFSLDSVTSFDKNHTRVNWVVRSPPVAIEEEKNKNIYFVRTKYYFVPTDCYLVRTKYYFVRTKYYFVPTDCYFVRTKSVFRGHEILFRAHEISISRPRYNAMTVASYSHVLGWPYSEIPKRGHLNTCQGRQCAKARSEWKVAKYKPTQRCLIWSPQKWGCKHNNS